MKKYKHKQTGLIASLTDNCYKVHSYTGVATILNVIIENSNDWELIPSVEVGKVYKYGNWMLLIKELIDANNVKAIGFSGKNEWFELDTIVLRSNLTEATKEEWFERLKEETIKRGFPESYIIYPSYHTIKTIDSFGYINSYKLDENLSLTHLGKKIMDSETGIWEAEMEKNSKKLTEYEFYKENLDVDKTIPTNQVIEEKPINIGSSGHGTIHDGSKNPSNSITLGSPTSEKTYIKGIEINERYSLAEIAEALNNLKNK